MNSFALILNYYLRKRTQGGITSLVHTDLERVDSQYTSKL